MAPVRKTIRQLKHGYSLLELMIVLAILVSIMAVSWPRISKRMQLIAPREAALQLKADLAEARDLAVTSGEAWVIRVQRGSAKYEIGPVSEIREEMFSDSISKTLGGEDPFAEFVNSVENPSPTATGTTTLGTTPGTLIQPVRIRRHELPAGMVFDDGFAHQVSDVNTVRVDPNQAQTLPPFGATTPNVTTLPATPTLQLVPAGQAVPALTLATSDNWKFAVIFQPDGRATESEIRLKEQATENKIRLRIRGFTGGVTIDKLERKPPVQPGLLPEDALLEPDPSSDPNYKINDAATPELPDLVTPSARSQR